MSNMVRVQRYEVVEGRRLAFVEGEPEPMIEDEDLALLMERPAGEVRKAVPRLTERGFFVAGEIREQGSRNPTEPKGRGRPAERRYVFTEDQAYALISQSRSELAARLTREMATVYKAWRRGLLVQAQAVAALTKRQEEAEERLKILEARPLRQLRLLNIGSGGPTFEELSERATALAGDEARFITSRDHLAMLMGVGVAVGRVVVAELLSTGRLVKVGPRIVTRELAAKITA